MPPLGSGSIADVFPHPISYQHPLIGHVMGNLHMEKQAKEGRPVDRAEAERERDDMGKLLNMQNETWGGLAGARKSKSPSPATNATPGVPAGSFGMACAWPKSQVPHDVDVDGLCDEMLMKASCKEVRALSRLRRVRGARADSCLNVPTDGPAAAAEVHQ